MIPRILNSLFVVVSSAACQRLQTPIRVEDGILGSWKLARQGVDVLLEKTLEGNNRGLYSVERFILSFETRQETQSQWSVVPNALRPVRRTHGMELRRNHTCMKQLTASMHDHAE